MRTFHTDILKHFLSGPKAAGWLANWQRRAADATKQVTTDGFPRVYNNTVWGEFKRVFEESHWKKCMYCEGQWRGGSFDSIDHYRPRNFSNHAYYWLAYHAENFVYSCEQCNTAKRAKFRTTFPNMIRDNDSDPFHSPSALDVSEDPWLIHPWASRSASCAQQKFASLEKLEISVDFAAGLLYFEPAHHLSEAEKDRVTCHVESLQLNRSALAEHRFAVCLTQGKLAYHAWGVLTASVKMEQVHVSDRRSLDRELVEKWAYLIVDSVKEEAEFSVAVAHFTRAVVLPCLSRWSDLELDELWAVVCRAWTVEGAL